MLPLEGITVVSVEQAVAAPFATRQLADLGARVIKIERPDGGDFARGYDTAVRGLSSYFVWLNRSKQSLTLDLKRPAAADIVTRLVAAADVFVQNLGPGAAERLNLPPAALRARHPRLIVCSISGYGTSGPYAEKKAYDLLVQSEAGLLSITGPADAPSRVGVSIADIAAGMYAYSGVLASLVARGRTGDGATIHVSLFDALAEWMACPIYYTAYGGTPPPRTGPHHPSIAPYGPFRARDGTVVYLAIQNAREWTRFCELVLARPELATDARFATNPARVAHRDVLHQTIDAVFATLTGTEAVGRLDAARIAWAHMNGVAEVVAHPQFAARGRWREIASPAGPLRALVPPAEIDDVDPVMEPVPALGEHTDAILRELGFAPDAIARFRSEGVI